MLGYQADDLIDAVIHDVIHHRDSGGVTCAFTDCKIGVAARGGASIRVEDEIFWHKNGSPVHVTYSVSPLIVGGLNTGSVINFTDVSNLHNAGLSVRLREERYRNLFASMDEGCCLIELIYDDAGRATNYRFLETNAAFDAQSGLVDAVGKTIVELVPDFEIEWIETYANVARTGTPFRFETEFKSMGYWFDVFVTRADDFGRISILFKDTTSRKKIAQDLKQSEEKVRLATDAAELGLWIWSATTNTITWENDKTYEIFGMAKADASINAAQFFSEIVHPDDRPSFAEAVKLTVETQARFYFEGRFLHLDSRELGWLEMTGVARGITNGRTETIIGTIKDISSRKTAQVQLEQSEERFRSLFESMDKAFCLIEMIFNEHGVAYDYRFLKVNPAFILHTGLSSIVGKTVNEVIPDLEPEWFIRFGEVALSGESTRFTQNAQALERSFEIYAMKTGTPDSPHVAVIFTDITERLRINNDLRRMAATLSEVDRRKNEFLATLAHELRNPLAPIRNALSLAPYLLNDPSALSNMFQMMERQVEQMVHLVDDLLDVARITTGKVELKQTTMAIQDIVARAVESSAHTIEEKGHSLRQLLPDQPLYVDIDVTRMIQVISNLINNAVKYSPAGSSIDILVSSEESEVTLSVIDTGVGISNAGLESVFDIFSQVSTSSSMAEGGLGIGLSLVRKLMELHGGSVSASSEGENKGSNFTLRLPHSLNLVSDANEIESTNTITTLNSETTIKMRVLVVDDNVDAAETLSTLLEIFGHDVKTCYDGCDAFTIVETFLPQVIFLDIGLPTLNGYEVARAIREMPGQQNTTLVALTGWGAEDDRKQAKDAGFNHHLTKPTGIDVISAILAELSEPVLIE